MTGTVHSFLIIAVVAVVTIVLRFLPFWIFPEGRETPQLITWLSSVLPCAVMGMLIVYCLKNVTPMNYPWGLPELIGVALTAGLYIWKRNTLLSILAGTAVYMILVQMVF
ncbi:MAG: branched-chain amino acid transporter permease [Eubacteriaceae bacterium]|jgi:branched-subunit amino acid transport protein AzlD